MPECTSVNGDYSCCAEDDVLRYIETMCALCVL
jgi:hypothetical protein